MNGCKIAMIVWGMAFVSVQADSIEVRTNEFNGYKHRLSIVVRAEASKVKISGGVGDPLVVTAKPGENLNGKELSFETAAAGNGLRRSSSVITVDVQGSKRMSAKIGDRVPKAAQLALE